MTAQIIDGKALATQEREKVRSRVSGIRAAGYRPPCLVMVLVGDDPASKVYVGSKTRACAKVGIESRTITLPAETPREELVQQIDQLNRDDGVDGILIQLPLPAHLKRTEMIALVNPEKDVDGLTPVNQGLLAWDLPGLYPCTPVGVIRLLQSSETPIEGAVASVIGRSVLVGATVSTLLSHMGATSICLHSLSKDPPSLTRQSDILVVAAGHHHLVDASWIKPGATVIDVGIHRTSNEPPKIEGDVDFASAAEVAGKITPVPGGVGPMTIAMLLANCVTAYERRCL